MYLYKTTTIWVFLSNGAEWYVYSATGEPVPYALH